MIERDGEKIEKLLKAQIAIQLNPDIANFSMIKKVEILKNAGIDYKTIAELLNTSPNSISVMFAKLNKNDRRN